MPDRCVLNVSETDWYEPFPSIGYGPKIVSWRPHPRAIRGLADLFLKSPFRLTVQRHDRFHWTFDVIQESKRCGATIDTINWIELMFDHDARLSELPISLQRPPDHRRQASPSQGQTALPHLPVLHSTTQPPLLSAAAAQDAHLPAVRLRVPGKATDRRKTAFAISPEILSHMLTVRSTQHLEAADNGRPRRRGGSKEAEGRFLVPLSEKTEARAEAAAGRSAWRVLRRLRLPREHRGARVSPPGPRHQGVHAREFQRVLGKTPH